MSDFKTRGTTAGSGNVRKNETNSNQQASFGDMVARKKLAPVELQPTTLPGFFKAELEARLHVYKASISPADQVQIVIKAQPLLGAEYDAYKQRAPLSTEGRKTLNELREEMRATLTSDKIAVTYGFERAPMSAEDEATRRALNLKPIETPLANMVESAISTSLARFSEYQEKQKKPHSLG